ncbi:hypothetical protein EUTSA_v10023046mg, partial [Eutrema salsugineum]
MARCISKWGWVVEELVMKTKVNNPRYSFMWRSDPFHAFYQQKLKEYLSQNQQDGANQYDVAAAAALAAQRNLVQPKLLYQQSLTEDDAAQGHLVNHQPIFMPDHLEVRLPKGMTVNEFETMKLTAQFGAWYGNNFWLGFKNRDGFEFTNPTDSRFPRFTRFVLEYSQCDDVMGWQLGGVKSMINWHASLEKHFFANNNDDAATAETGTGMSPPEPEPFNEPGLVPEDQFLAQHPGWCTIRVSVADIDGSKPIVIEKTVQSLSENVASLKEQIAEQIPIPPEKQVACILQCGSRRNPNSVLVCVWERERFGQGLSMLELLAKAF